MRMRRLFQLRFAVRAGEHADGITHAGIAARFEVDEDEIEEGLQELHGEEFDFDFDDEE